MTLKWSDLVFTPDDEAVQALRSAWAWLLKEPFSPVLFSALGDVFFQSESGDIFWLNTGLAEVTHAATTLEQFQELLNTDVVEDWLLPELVAELHAVGKIAGPGCCYTYVTLPIFKEGEYQSSNFNAVPARQHFAATGYLHEQIQSLPDGAAVQIKIVP